jgi:predicted RNA-binding Zn-ribbon protein involved in translation (DUF1610 family)
MFHECPNCRASVPLHRTIRLTAWGSFRCANCGSVLGVSRPRRLLGVAIWVAGFWALTAFLRLSTWGALVSYGTGIVSLVMIFFLVEKVVLVERRAFTCKLCGYDLEGLTKHRCPECGTEFDPAERAEILARIGLPAARPRYVWLAVLIVAITSLAVVAGVIVWERVSPAAAGRAGAPAAPAGPAASQRGA